MVLLVAVAALGFTYPLNDQDVSRLALSQSLVLRASITIDPYAHETTSDKAFHSGHWYSDKAPGISFIAVPVVAAGLGLRDLTKRLGIPDGAGLHSSRVGVWHSRTLRYAARLFTGGLAFLIAIALLWRVADVIRPRTDAAVAITFAIGTLAFPLAATMFGHLAAGLAEVSSFLLVWLRSASSRSLFLAGFLAGCGLLIEYQAAVAAVVIAAYLLLRFRNPAKLMLLIAGAVPPVLVLGAYNWKAFGSPFHFSYGYVPIPAQSKGLFGISAPTWNGADKLFIGAHGILRDQPILVLAVAGLVLLWRRGFGREATVCAIVAIAFGIITTGYFQPYGGESPGPRFFVVALPFLALGLPDSFARWPRTTSLVAAVSLARMVYVAGRWNLGPHWPTIWTHAGLPPTVAALIVATGAGAGFALAVAPSWRVPPPGFEVLGSRHRWGRWRRTTIPAVSAEAEREPTESGFGTPTL
jgi:hypothetical protein